MLDLINQLIPELLALLALVIVYCVRSGIKAWLPKIEEYINAHISARTQQVILELGVEAFAYAETVFREKNGAEKLNEALKYFNANMSRYGLSNLTAEAIRAAIEKAWLEDKRKEQLAPVELAEIRVLEGTK
jgi:LL-H family phage holin